MKRIIVLTSLFVIFVLNPVHASGQTTQFTHQGNLGFSTTGNYDFDLKLYDTPATGTGTQQGATIQRLSVSVTNGAFSLSLDFGATVFTGAELFLETGWRVAGSGVFTVLSPREKITAVYANRSLSAATADNSTQLGGLPASAFIQNTTLPQTGNFNVAGNGTAGGTLSGGTVNSTTQFNLAGNRVLSNAGVDNLFAGRWAGNGNTSGLGNSFFGSAAGYTTTTGSYNSFFGDYAGYLNTSGAYNTVMGAVAGNSNTTGNSNSFFGDSAGYGNTTGSFNAFFGDRAGVASTADYNAFFGSVAGFANTTGTHNAFFGYGAAYQNTTGSSNTFFGDQTGFANTTGSANTLIGSAANLTSSNLTNATAIGARAMAGQSNSLVLGSINGVNGATADTFVGIGTTTPSSRLHVIDPLNTGLRVQTNSTGGTVASFGGNGDFQIDAPGIVAGRFVVAQAGNTGIGIAIPNAKLHVRANNGNVLIGDAGCGAGFTGIGFGSSMTSCTNYSLLGDGTNTFINRPSGGSIFFRSGNNTQVSITPSGTLTLATLGFAGSLHLCINGSSEVSLCSSSLRYKTNIAPFAAGLNLVNRLQPITFNWKENGEADFGLGAEDVAKVEPLLVIHNNKGEVEGVKYDRVAVVLLNAVKEQQQQIEALKKIVCLDHPQAEMCEATPRPIKVSEGKP